ncbi:hypothetical protein Tco_1336512 [Tanacetum coccineum]
MVMPLRIVLSLKGPYTPKRLSQSDKEMWEAIERLQQGESLNIQDVKTNLFWKFGQFTSHDGEIIESYYTRFYKMMNEMIRNNLTVATMQVNVHILLHTTSNTDCQDLSQCEATTTQVVRSAQSWIQCFNCTDFGHLLRNAESKTPEQSLMARRQQMNEIDDQALEAIYRYMARRYRMVPNARPLGIDLQLLEQ